MKIAKIYIDQKNKRLDRPFDYLVPDHAQAGMRTLQQFGNGNRLTKGFIVGFCEASDYEQELKSITQFIDDKPILTKEQIKLCLFLKQSYFCLFWEVLSLFTAYAPIQRCADGFRAYRLKPLWLYRYIKEPPRPGAVQEEILGYLKWGSKTHQELLKRFPKGHQSIRSLIQQDCIQREKHQNPVLSGMTEKSKELTESLDGLQNVKTQPAEDHAFFNCASTEDLLDFLIPLIQKARTEQADIAILTPGQDEMDQIFKAISNRFGFEPFTYSAKQSLEERYAFSELVRQGGVPFSLIGPSGLFLPFSDKPLYLIVSDVGSEQYTLSASLGIELIPFLDEMAKLLPIKLFYSDRYTSVEAKKQLEDGLWHEKKLADRKLDRLEVCYMDKELRAGNTGIVSRALAESIQRSLQNEKKSLLLLNRKGYMRQVFCRSCGESLKCPHCQISLQLNQKTNTLFCPSCGYQERYTKVCPNCQSKYLRASGMGVEKAKEQLKKLFPEASVGLYPDEEEADILIGTQAILSYPVSDKTGTAGALLADLDLDYPDYRSEENGVRLYERFFHKVSEASQADCFLQTYHRESQAVRAILGEEEAFLDEQSVYRSLCDLPPYATLIMFTLRAESFDTAFREAKILRKRIGQEADRQGIEAEILELFRITARPGSVRFSLKTKDKRLHGLIQKLYEDGEIEAMRSNVSVKFNPTSLL